MKINLPFPIFGGLVATLFCFITVASISLASSSADNLENNLQRNDVLVGVHWDNRWLAKFGNNTDQARSAIRDIVEEATGYFRQDDTSRLTYKIEWWPYTPMPDVRLSIGSEKRKGINEARKLAKASSKDSTIFLYFTDRPNKPGVFVAGVPSKIGSVCSSRKEDRSAVVAWTEDKSTTALILANTIGNLMTKGSKNRKCLSCKNDLWEDSRCEALKPSQMCFKNETVKRSCRRSCLLC